MNKKLMEKCSETPIGDAAPRPTYACPCDSCVHKNVCKHKVHMDALQQEIELLFEKDASTGILELIGRVEYNCRERLFPKDSRDKW